jgi:ABC-type amino acid transport substrate-binding protein
VLKRQQRFLIGYLLLTILVVGFGLPTASQAAGPDGQAEEPLRVVTKEIEPFVIEDRERLTGFSIELWQEISLVTGLPFEFIEVETVGDQLEALANGDADVAIAAISMTPEREEQFDFSYPYFRSGLQIMTTSRSADILIPLLLVVSSPQFLIAAGGLLLILLVVGHLVWFVERKNNPDFPPRYWPGIWEGLWWSAVTVTTVGYGDKTVKDMLGRIVGIVWMFAGIFLIANFTAVVTAQATLTELQTSISGVEDLPDKRVAAVAGTTSADYLRAEGLPFREVETIDGAYRLLERGTIDAIVYDAPVLQYYAATAGDRRLTVVGAPFNREDYGIAFPPGSPYEEMINQTLLEIRVNGTYEEISNRWFISEDGS